MTIREWAQRYISLGWYPIRLAPFTKKLADKDGLERVYTAEDFQTDDNVGLRLIPESDPRSVKLVAVDFDAPELTPEHIRALLPTTAGWGRESKPISQLLYVSPFKESVQLKDRGGDPKKSTLVEIRASHQSMCPPSVHPDGEEVRWLSDDLTALEIAPTELRRRANLVASLVLIIRYYPGRGARHFFGLYLAGFLRQLGLTLEETSTLLRLAGQAVGDADEKDRTDAASSTYAKPEDDPIAGAQKLIDDVGETGAAFVRSLRGVWGATGRGFETDDQGKKISPNNVENIMRALSKLDVQLSYDLFASRPLYVNGGPPVRLDDTTTLKLWFDIDKRFQFRPTKDFFIDVLNNAAFSNPFHPVRDYLNRLNWDGRPRIDEWLIRYGGAEDTRLTRAISAIFMMAAVRRIRHPGCKYDELLVLESTQGLNKSSALQALCPNSDWFSSDLPLGVDAKQMIERTSGRWIIEVAELVGGKREAEHIKASLSRQVDGPVRLSYGRLPVEKPRQFVLVGTTNPAQYLKDLSGNRRFWPIEVKTFSVQGILDDRDQLWAEAAHRETRGDSTRLDPTLYNDAERQQEKKRAQDPWEEVIELIIESTEVKQLPSLRGTHERSGQRIFDRDIWGRLGIPLDRRSPHEAVRICDIMRRHNFAKLKIRDGREVLMGWGRDMTEGQLGLPIIKSKS